MQLTEETSLSLLLIHELFGLASGTAAGEAAGGMQERCEET